MKKFTIGFMVFAMILSLVAIGAVPANAVADGSLVKTADSSAVWYINGGKKHVFPDEKTYKSWYPDFSGVMTISATEMGDYAFGPNVTYRPGTSLVTIASINTVYAVEPGGVLRSLVSEENAIALYGANWATRVKDVIEGYFVNYTVGDDMEVGKYPTGTIIKEEGSATTYYIDGNDRRAIATGDAFEANKFNWSYLVTTNNLSGYTDGSSITAAESDLTNVAGSGGGTVTPAGSVTVALASDTPAAGSTYLKSQARANYLVVNVTNNSSADVTIDSVTIERGGYAVDADFASVGLIADAINGTQVGLNKTFNSNHQAIVGDDIVVKAGTTKKLYVVGNMAGSTMTASTPKLGIVSMALKSGATLNGSFPIWGNVMSLNTSVTIATATIVAGSSDPSSDSTPKVGDTNVELSQIKVTNDSATEEIQVERVVWRQAGTVADSDILSYSLYNSDDGTKLASAAQVDKYIEFNLSGSPLKIGKSKNVELMVKADMIDSGSSRTIQLDIYRNTDVVIKGLGYNAYVIPTYTGVSSQPYYDQTDSQTIGNGTLRVEPDSTFAAQNIAEGKSGTQVGQWLFTVKGEPVDITAIGASLTVSGTGNMADITGGIFYNVETNAGLTGATDAAPSGTSQTGGVSSTDTISLPVGVHKIGLKVNLNSDFANNTTIIAGIDPDNDLTVTGQVTGNTITASPTANQAASTMTIKAASLAVSASNNPAPSTVIRGTNSFAAANIQLDASGSGDNLTVTQLKTIIKTNGMNPAELSNLKIYDGATELNINTDPDPTATSAGSVTTTWTFSPAIKVTKGTVKTLTVKLNVASTPSANEWFKVGFQNGCTATTKDSEGETVNPSYSYSDGQQMTISEAGTLTITRSDSYTNAFLSGNSTGVSIGKFKAAALYENVNIEQLYVNMTAYNNGSTDEVTNMYLYDGATQIASATITSSTAVPVLFDMTGSPYTVPVNTEKELTIKVDTAVISKSGTPTNANPLEGFTPGIQSTTITAKGVSGTDATITSATLTFPNYALVKSQPTITISSTGDSVTGNSNYDLIDVTVAADSKGPIGLYKMTFRIATTTVSATDLTMYEGSTLVATEDADDTEGINHSYIDGSYALVEVYFNLGGSIGGQMREISAGTSKTYTLKATITGYDSSVSNSVSTSMTGDDALAASTYSLNAVAVDTTDDDDFIWSDLAYGNTSTTAPSSVTTTVQWMNGFLVDGLLTTTSSAKSI